VPGQRWPMSVFMHWSMDGTAQPNMGMIVPNKGMFRVRWLVASTRPPHPAA